MKISFEISFSSGILLLLLSSALAQGGRRRKFTTTTTTTTEASAVVNLEQALADREANLMDREENFRKREAVFRMREEKLSQREEQFKDREDKLSKREKNLALREQNTVSRSCSADNSSAETLPDYNIVRWDRDSGVLKEIGEIGACSDHMRFFASRDNETEGRCDCDYHECSRPLIYSEKYKQCFWAWSQGECEQNEWFVYDDVYNPTCERNPCPESASIGTSSYYFKHAEDGKCYKVGSKGPCKGKNERLFTLPEDPIPRCRKETLCPAISIPATERCVPGNRRWIDGLCADMLSYDEVE